MKTYLEFERDIKVLEEELEKLLNDINSKMKQEFDTLTKESSN